MNIFEQATRTGLRFETAKGNITVEDVWHLPLTSNVGKTNLDTLAQGYFAELKSESNVSFVNPAHKMNAVTQLRFDIVKHIIDVKIAERDAQATSAANKERAQRLMAIVESKEMDALSSKSVEELRAEIAALSRA